MIASGKIFDKQALIETVKGQFAKAKDWTDKNPNLAIGAAAFSGLVALAGLLSIVPAWKARGADKRPGRYRRESRFMKRAADEYNGLDLDLNDEEFMEFLAGMVDELEEN
jgi:hypothetical protein